MIFETLLNRELEGFSHYYAIKPEYSYENSRFDFLLMTEKDERCLLEVKSCTLVEKGVALFPDAPTKRGRRHIMDLIKAVTDGYKASILFLIQRNDARFFTLNDIADPEFGKCLRKAVISNVEIKAYCS